MNSAVTQTPPAAPDEALAHFQRRLGFETDCWDVHQALTAGRTERTERSAATPDFVLLDVRGLGAFARGHVPGAVNLPHATITAATLARWPTDTLFVVYCAGPHCNGANKAALRLAALGRPVKEMIGGITGWHDEGFELARGAAEQS